MCLTIELPLLTGGITLHLNMRNLIRSNLSCICPVQITTSKIAMYILVFEIPTLTCNLKKYEFLFLVLLSNIFQLFSIHDRASS